MGLNKRVLITGATAGIGKETAKQLAVKNFDVYFVGRNKQRCEETLQELQQLNSNNQYGYFIANFEDLQQVKQVAKEITQQFTFLDVLINNAGAVYAKRELTEQGFEKTFAVNHLAPFLLTNLLLPLIKQAPQGRIVTVASDSHYPGTMDFKDLFLEKGYFVLRAYERSKLANVLFSNHLATLLKDTVITVNSLNPGRVKSEIGNKNTGFLFSHIWKLVDIITGIPTADGAKTSVYLASSNEVTNVSGNYFDKCKIKTPSKLAQNSQLASELWTKSTSLVADFL